MTYRELWQSLTTVYDEREAKAVARLVLEERFSLALSDVLAGRMPDDSELTEIVRRLMTGEPVQYVLGWAEFNELRFHVEPGVLIPRPETQWMCDFVSSSWGFLPREGSILDIGTGSGCIACTIALDLSLDPVEVVGWDISDKALRIARENAERLGVKVRFENVDILKLSSQDSQPGQSTPAAQGYSPYWDIIVSNPPYVCEREKASMARNVLAFEPAEALFVPDDDPLLFYRSIGRYAYETLKPEGFLLVEINTQYGDAVGNLFCDMGFVGTTIFKDQFEKDRFVLANKE